jgi:signal transduction histidine kinase
MRVHDKEMQIDLLDKANVAKAGEIHRERIYLITFSCLAVAIIVLLVAYGRNQYVRKRQAQQLTAQNKALQENKLLEMQRRHRIDSMQGAIDAEENERHKIADQLHDETGSMLALASLNISSVLENGQADERSADKIQKAHELLNTVSSSLRDISHRLTPLIIEKYGFRKSLEDSIEAINLSKKIRFETVIIGFENDKKYPVSFLNNLYRIIQELAHNILKHAQATEALLELVEHENHIAIMVEDNGTGIGDYTQSKGWGLRSIQSKIAYLNGKIEIINKNDGGTLVVMEFIV